VLVPVHTDPVCHMQVDQNTAAAVSEHQGKRYYFCSKGCKEKFDRNPGQYAGAAR
jgi:P-type Cu+ transporter